MPTQFTHVCPSCGTSFQSDREAARFCSRLCANRAHAKGKVERICRHCGKAEMVFPSTLARGRVFCSVACSEAGKRPGGTAPVDPKIRYAALVEQRGPDECWPWIAARDRDGYGLFTLSTGKQITAHRFGYMLAHGLNEIPAGMKVCHHCDNPPCQNPAHGFLGTTRANNEDKARKGRAARGETFVKSKLTDDDVRSIRRLKAEGISADTLATRFGVIPQNIYHIVARRTWRHVE